MPGKGVGQESGALRGSPTVLAGACADKRLKAPFHPLLSAGWQIPDSLAEKELVGRYAGPQLT